MPPTLQELGIDRLSIEDRLLLIGEIWDSVAPLPMPEHEKQLLDERLAEADANPGAGAPWEEVLARLRLPQ